MLNNLFHLEKSLNFADSSAQHLLLQGESCLLFWEKGGGGSFEFAMLPENNASVAVAFLR